jgi:hypothetical protein
MGFLTLDTSTENFRSELLLALFDRTDTTNAVPNSRLDLWINQAYRHVTYPSVYMHHELETNYDITLTTSGTYPLDATTVGFQINGVKNVTHYEAAVASVDDLTRKNKLRPRSITWFDERTLTTGRPSRYAIYGETLFVDAPPSTGYVGQLLRVRVWQEAALLTTGLATVIPSIWDEVILLGARWRAERDLGYADRAELTKQNYAALLNEYRERQDFNAMDTEWLPGLELGNSVMG